ncbi:outer membrane protein assembly factor BamA [Candidatus Kinetoplastidibacterium crithidiae]|uniref:Outer membrane protein assembly factor BamA n=1 Tax=Candidatus Kinetoplastidibacterium crithidiae TCC036E TaxID=1208918 RepID=M1M675_9PROT|nr:outer membrane protein assembly factor BamA [Candidatus Kinetoplastibacterium crithidii]AGF47615.1 outer membrane protein/protective antigen OMA87 [Candidatus Kinetoplastibacterium crithidii TCC036E]
MEKYIFFIIITISNCSYAFDSFTVEDIKINGIATIDKVCITKALQVKVGDVFEEKNIKQSIKNIYDLGFFEQVSLDIDKNIIILNVEERPIIHSVIINGMSVLSSKDFLRVLEQYGLVAGNHFNKNLLKKSVDTIKELYELKSFYNTSIKYSINNLPTNCVDIEFNVEEPKISKIKSIKIIGNNIFSEEQILRLFTSTSSSLFSWYSKSNYFLIGKIEYDIEKLISYYMDLGYLDFSIINKQFNFSKDNNVDIVIVVKEGKKYKINDIKIFGDLNGLDEIISELVTIRKDEYFSLNSINYITSNIKELLGNYGYAFAQVAPTTKIEHDTDKVNIIFNINCGKKIYINNINIIGNRRTSDYVIRRVIKQYEASLYNFDNVNFSKKNIDRLGFFEKVDFRLKQRVDHDDLADLEVEVVDKHTGIANFGMGYSASEGPIISASVSEDNIFGTGNDLSLDVNASKIGKNMTISYHNPYVTKDAISSIFSAFYKINNPIENSNKYEINSSGSSINIGLPLSEYNKVFLGLSFEKNKIGLHNKLPYIYNTFVNEYGDNTNSFILSSGWFKDTRNNNILPSSGSYSKLSLDVSTNDLQYFAIKFQRQYYIHFMDKCIFSFNGAIDYGLSYGKRSYPTIKHLYAGGIGTVRGYIPSSIGPKHTITGDYLGGSARIIANAQVYFPFPELINDKKINWFLFSDVGKVFCEKKAKSNIYKNDSLFIDNNGYCYSAGIGVSWLSPLGLIQLSYAMPLNISRPDDIQRLQFQIGSGF